MRRKLIAIVAMVYLLYAYPAWPQNNLWTSLGPEGGPIVSISIDPRNPRTLYAGNDLGSFKSGDGGRSWFKSDVPNGSRLVFDPQNSNVVYALPRLNVLGRLQKSTDGGTSWKDSGPPQRGFPAYAPFAIPTEAVLDLVIDPQSSNILFVATIRGVFKSVDGAESWSAINTGLTSLSVHTLVMDPQHHDTLYAGTRGGVFKTTDAGESWDLVMEGATRFALAVDPYRSDTVYAAPWNEPIFKSTDGGKSWIASKNRPTKPFFSLVIDPHDTRTIFACCAPAELDAGLWKSTDGGETWAEADLKTHYSFAIDPRDLATFYAGTDGGVLKSTDKGKSWSAANFGMLATGVSVLAVDPQDANTVYASIGPRRQIFKSTDSGTRWVPIGLSPDVSYALAIHPRDSRIIYAAGGSGLFKSLDGGETWGVLGPAASYSAVAVDPQNPDTVYAGSWHPDGRVFSSRDGGYTWFTPAQNFSEYSRDGRTICSPGVASLAVDSKNRNRLYATVYDCNDAISVVWRSADGGINWERANIFGVGPIVADPQKADTVYVGTGNGIARSEDGGTSWKLQESGLPPLLFIRALAMDSETPKTLYAAGFTIIPLSVSSVFKSIDGGVSWSSFDDGLTNPGIETLTVGSRGPNTLYAGSARGLWRVFDDMPVVSSDASQYCVGGSWNLKVGNGATNTSIGLMGTSNGQSWDVRDWRKTNVSGNWTESGTFAAGTEGRHYLRVNIAGRLSNVVSFVTSNCTP